MTRTDDLGRELAVLNNSQLIVPKEEKIICEVCGHANPEFAAVCQMCSNYLKGMRER